MKLFALALLLSVISVAGVGCKPTPSVVELPRPNSGTFSEAEAEARKFEILSNAPSLRLENWKYRNMGFCIHIATNDSITVYGHPGKELPKLFPEYDKAPVNPSPAEIEKMIDEVRLPGVPRFVLITSDKSLNNSKTIHELLK